VTSAARGTIDREGAYIVFRFERTFRQPMEKVWAALGEHVHPDATVTWQLSDDAGDGDGTGGTGGTGGTSGDAGDGDGAAARGGRDGGSRLTLTHRLSDSDLDNAAADDRPARDRGLLIARNAEAWCRILDELAAIMGDGLASAGGDPASAGSPGAE
jgi:hypothetical protein